MREAERGLTSLGGPAPDAAVPTTRASPLPRILCVDDEPAVLKVLTRALEHDFEIVTANDPMKALVLLEHGMDFSVVISDMRMPQMDGAEFLSRVRRIAPNSTRLALTACLERELPAEEVFGILTKPCPLNLLHASVQAAVEHHLMRTLLARNESTRVPEPQRIDLRPLDRDPRLLPQLPELEFDPWHVARAMGNPATQTTASETLSAGTTTGGIVSDTSADAEAPRLSMLAGVAEKFFRLGHAREAERILRPALWDFLQRCEGNRRGIESGIARAAPSYTHHYPANYAAKLAASFAPNPADSDAEDLAEKESELAGKLALRLATDTNAVQWIDYLFRLFTSVSRPLSPDLIEQLHDLMRRAPGVSRNGFLRYLSTLRACRHEFGPGEHFLIRRIEGLEPLLGRQ